MLPSKTNNVPLLSFLPLQLLQDEIMRLRGQLEEQDHYIRQLKQQRLDDYVRFDKRIADLQN